ncbi:adenosine deaminase [Geodermatophilus sp. YIM 151500]|uniref:adenosine deaminase n=1 Tax=Geodermatophilus sp. YIM 151500 TaxID=2984531 RepID=UPI0021E4EF33|nr:adenosine deaminase [Geodermatophilus sp. YIM 151500]MCV2488362.1 adenosine deaminase [Geodermatophilus sp. YIM 151500]
MLPLAELHVHVEGTLEADLLVRLARRNGVPLPSDDPAELTARYADFADLQAFLDVYYANLAVLRTEEDFHDLAAAYLSRAAAAGVRRAEVFCDPQTHVRNGVPLEAVFRGLGAAFAEARAAGMSADLVVCFLRDLGGDAAVDLLRRALPHREHFIGVGLDSAEVGHPPALFREAYEMAAAEGLHRVAHAGEEGGPEYVREALDVLGVERVDHGNRALEDPDLVARLRDERVPLTVCPLSNVALKGVPRIEDHPLPRMLELGLVATVNSDDPAYFGGYVDDVVAAVRTALGVSDDDLAVLARNSFAAAFADDADRSRWLGEVDAWRAAPPR